MPEDQPSNVIVAIPKQDDYVWRLSSEKIPHLTIMHMDVLPETSNIQEFIAHIVNTTLYRFSLYVDRRGELGDKKADVLFFEKDNVYTKLQEFRTYLLNHPDIYKAYHSVEQYPEWTPHLTLGYPDTPAKKDTRDYPGLYWVEFDRIALWTQDYDGVEFPLSSTNQLDVAMSIEDGKRFVEHYGVKGMKWGVRKDDAARVATLGAKALASRGEKTRTEQIIRNVSKSGGVRSINDRELESLLRRMDMEARYSRLAIEHKKQKAKGREATLKFLGEVGKITLPILLSAAAARAASSPKVYRTSAVIARKAIGS